MSRFAEQGGGGFTHGQHVEAAGECHDHGEYREQRGHRPGRRLTAGLEEQEAVVRFQPVETLRHPQRPKAAIREIASRPLPRTSGSRI